MARPHDVEVEEDGRRGGDSELRRLQRFWLHVVALAVVDQDEAWIRRIVAGRDLILEAAGIEPGYWDRTMRPLADAMRTERELAELEHATQTDPAWRDRSEARAALGPPGSHWADLGKRGTMIMTSTSERCTIRVPCSVSRRRSWPVRTSPPTRSTRSWRAGVTMAALSASEGENMAGGEDAMSSACRRPAELERKTGIKP